MFGWRGKIGLMVPARNQVMEPDLYRFVPDGVSIHSVRLRRDRDVSDIKTNTEMLELVDDAGELLAQAGVDIILLGCTAASFIGGPGEDRKISERIYAKTNIVSTTTSTAAMRAVEALKISSLTVITPYIEELNKRETDFFEGNGIKIAAIHGMGIEQTSRLPKVMPGDIYRFVKENHGRDAGDAVFISCTNFRAMEAIKYLETDLRKPVLSSNQVSLWYTLRKLGIHDSVQGCGRLMEI